MHKPSHEFVEIAPVHANQAIEAVVGVAVHKQDRLVWAKQAIDSILNQSFKNFTVVVVIDGEVDISISSYLKELARSRDNLGVFHSTINLGLSSCMNFVIDWMLANASQAKYFFRMDSDDISLPGRFEKQVEFFEANGGVSVLGTSLLEINEKGKNVGKRELPIADHQIKCILPRRCAINHPTVAIRTEVFKEGYRYRPQLKNTQDYFLWAELCAAGYRFANLPEALLEFRRVNDFYKRRGLSKSINEFKARFYTMKVLDRYSIRNIIYACAVLFLRLMPAKLVKLAYKIDRYLLNKRVRHE